MIDNEGNRIILGRGDKSKALDKVCAVKEADMPTWFKNGMVAAMMPPTAVNQQRFYVSLDGEDAVIIQQSKREDFI